MRLVGTSEWIVIGALILYIAFTPGFPVVRQFLSTGVGKAVGLATVVAVWKYVSHPVALLLLVNFVRCSGMREYLESGSGSGSGSGTTGSGAPPNTYCPENYNFENGACKNKTTGASLPATVCLPGQSWDGSKCTGTASTSTSSGAGAMTGSGSGSSSSSSSGSSSGSTKQGFTVMTPDNYQGVQPNLAGGGNFAPAPK